MIKLNKQKKAFALISAVIFVVIIATLGMLALSFSTKNSSQSLDVYFKEQGDILARNATEFAILAMQKHDYSKNCLKSFVIYYPKAKVDTTGGFSCSGECLYRIDVNYYYLDASMAKSCGTSHVISTTQLKLNKKQHPSGHSALIDVKVYHSAELTEPVAVSRQSIEQP